jgi:cyanuric acid amidohydrolase
VRWRKVDVRQDDDAGHALPLPYDRKLEHRGNREPTSTAQHSGKRLIGASRFSLSPFTIGHAVMRDAIDLVAVMQALESVGLSVFDARSQNRLVNIFAKAEASPDEDSDINTTRHARAAVGGLIGGVSGTGAVYVSGGAKHQGPAGGGPVAVIARA